MFLMMILGEKSYYTEMRFDVGDGDLGVDGGRDAEREVFGEVVQSFNYLGATITNDSSCAENVRLRIIAATASMAWQ